MSKDDKTITGSQESIQARLAALNAMIHKTKEPEPVQEEPVIEAAENTVEVTAADQIERAVWDTPEEVSTDGTSAEGENTAAEAPAEEAASNEAAEENAEAETAETAEAAPEAEVAEAAAEVVSEEVSAEAEAAPEAAAETTPEADAPEAAAENAEAVTEASEVAEEAAAETATEAEAATEADVADAADAAEAAPATEITEEAIAEETTAEAPEAAPAEEVPAEAEAPEQAAPEAVSEESAPAEPIAEEAPAAEPVSEPAPEAKSGSMSSAASLKERMGALMAATRGTASNNASEASAIIQSAGDDVNSLMKAGFEALEESSFDKAKEIFDSAAEKDKKRAAAYFGQLLAYFNVKDTTEFYDLVMIRTRKNLPKKKVTPPLFNDFEAYIKSGLKCSAELGPKEIKILFGHMKAPYKSIVGGIETTLDENKDLVEVYCDYMGNPASLYYHSFKENATEADLASYDINPALREGLAKLKEEEIEADRRRNSGEELTAFLAQVDETYDSLADSGLDPALRIAAALKKLNHLGAVPFGRKPGKDAPVAWIPVCDNGDNILLMTRECIEFMLFGQTNKWADSQIRLWLNGTFYVDYFNDQERSLILKESQENPGNTKFGTDGGKTTRDNFFIFSIAEANKYFSEEGERASDEWYWLRSPGGGGNYVAAIEPSGRIDEYGSLMSLDSGGVRPAVWINFSGKSE
ncbi:MAG: hypothetical protein J5825_03610 [Lachnospiraceae bacterium]|nr:hypothetical protein [Lachnospiraceae bacterium]